MNVRTGQAAEVTHWRNAVVVAYAVSGIAFATWVSRLPAIRDGLDLTPGNVGLLLLCLTLGSFISVSASGLIVLRFGSKQTIRIGSIMVGSGLVLAGLGTSVLVNPLVVAAGLAVIGLGTASWNTASNVEGAAVERAVRRHIMPRLHGAFSLGTVAGAGDGRLGGGRRCARVLALRRCGAAGGRLRGHRRLLVPRGQSPRSSPARASRRPHRTPSMTLPPGRSPHQAEADRPEAPLDNKRQIAQAWRDRRTLLLGVLVLGLALAEGAAGDWVALALADGHGQSDAAGAAGYGLFVTFMTVGRFAGTVVLDRFGRVPVMRWCAALAVLGLGLFVFAPAPWVAYVALAVWGLGASLGFPVGMSAAADDPRQGGRPGFRGLHDRLRRFPLRPAAAGPAGGTRRHPALPAGRDGDAGGQLPALPGGPENRAATCLGDSGHTRLGWSGDPDICFPP